MFPKVTIELPNWINQLITDPYQVYPALEDRMQLVIKLSQMNVEKRTGGPFGAGIFDMENHTLLAPGVNLVVPLNCSVAHAEMVAIMIAQQCVQHFDLGNDELHGYELIASTEPCAMCFGATPWSGVRQLVCGARDEDARQIGFDEGPKLPDWRTALENRGIKVIRDVCRDEAVNVLKAYRNNGGLIYNGRQGS